MKEVKLNKTKRNKARVSRAVCVQQGLTSNEMKGPFVHGSTLFSSLHMSRQCFISGPDVQHLDERPRKSGVLLVFSVGLDLSTQQSSPSRGCCSSRRCRSPRQSLSLPALVPLTHCAVISWLGQGRNRCPTCCRP